MKFEKFQFQFKFHKIMKINQEDSIKLYLRIKPPQIIDEPYYSIDKTKSIFTLKNRGHKKNDENI